MEIYYSNQTVRSGPSEPYYRVATTTAKDFFDLLEYIQEAGKPVLDPKTASETELEALKEPNWVALSYPDRQFDSHRSKIKPYIGVKREMLPLVEKYGGVAVPPEYLEVVMMMLKKDFRETRCYEPAIRSVTDYLDAKIRDKVVLLLRAEEWIDQPSDERIKKLNQQIENIDLGRRKDLNFSSEQNPTKYLDQKPIETNPQIRRWKGLPLAQKIEFLRKMGTESSYFLSLIKSRGLVPSHLGHLFQEVVDSFRD